MAKENVTKKWEEIKKTRIMCAALVPVCKLGRGECN
jgi:hypothetical protein